MYSRKDVSLFFAMPFFFQFFKVKTTDGTILDGWWFLSQLCYKQEEYKEPYVH